MSKMYILVGDWVPDNFVPVSVAHASLMGHLKWHLDYSYKEWLQNSFKKVVCKVSREEWNLILSLCSQCLIVTESRLNDQEMCLVIPPEDHVIPQLAKLALWKPKK